MGVVGTSGRPNKELEKRNEKKEKCKEEKGLNHAFATAFPPALLFVLFLLLLLFAARFLACLAVQASQYHFPTGGFTSPIHVRWNCIT